MAAVLSKARRIQRDGRVLRAFIAVYCREHHLKRGVAVHSHEQGRVYCAECHALLHYALQRNERCPLDPKPACRRCPVHCYKKQQRDKIRAVMKFSGRYYVMRGRLDWLWHYFF